MYESDISDKETKKLELLQKAVDHRKSCQTCSDRHVCDELAGINLELLIYCI